MEVKKGNCVGCMKLSQFSSGKDCVYTLMEESDIEAHDRALVLSLRCGYCENTVFSMGNVRRFFAKSVEGSVLFLHINEWCSFVGCVAD